MPKSVKGVAGRTPPTPTDSHAIIDKCIRQHMPKIQTLTSEVDRMITTAITGLQYAVTRSRPHYSLPDLGCIIQLAPYHVTMNIVFYGGADFASPPPLGDVDRTRYIKVATFEDIQTPEIAAWIAEAGRTPGWR